MVGHPDHDGRADDEARRRCRRRHAGRWRRCPARWTAAPTTCRAPPRTRADVGDLDHGDGDGQAGGAPQGIAEPHRAEGKMGERPGARRCAASTRRPSPSAGRPRTGARPPRARRRPPSPWRCRARGRGSPDRANRAKSPRSDSRGRTVGRAVDGSSSSVGLQLGRDQLRRARSTWSRGPRPRWCGSSTGWASPSQISGAVGGASPPPAPVTASAGSGSRRPVLVADQRGVAGDPFDPPHELGERHRARRGAGRGVGRARELRRAGERALVATSSSASPDPGGRVPGRRPGGRRPRRPPPAGAGGCRATVGARSAGRRGCR